MSENLLRVIYHYSILLNCFCFQMISYDSERGGVSVSTVKGPTTVSVLLIRDARTSDSGQYKCSPSNSKDKTVTVHVLNGKSTYRDCGSFHQIFS